MASSPTVSRRRAPRLFLWMLALGLPLLFGVLLHTYRDWLTLRYHACRATILEDNHSLVLVMQEMRKAPDPALMRWMVPTLDGTDFYTVLPHQSFSREDPEALFAGTRIIFARLLSDRVLADWVEVGPEALPLLFDGLIQLLLSPDLHLLEAIDRLDPEGAALLAWAEQQPHEPAILDTYRRADLVTALVSADPERGTRILADWIRAGPPPTVHDPRVKGRPRLRVPLPLVVAVALEIPLPGMPESYVNLMKEDPEQTRSRVLAALAGKGPPHLLSGTWAWGGPRHVDDEGNWRFDGGITDLDAYCNTPFHLGYIHSRQKLPGGMTHQGIWSRPLWIRLQPRSEGSTQLLIHAVARVHSRHFLGELDQSLSPGQRVRIPMQRSDSAGVQRRIDALDKPAD